jgi:hypothetical protein
VEKRDEGKEKRKGMGSVFLYGEGATATGMNGSNAAVPLRACGGLAAEHGQCSVALQANATEVHRKASGAAATRNSAHAPADISTSISAIQGLVKIRSHYADLLRLIFAGGAFAMSNSITLLRTVNFGMPIFLRACEDAPVCAKTSGAVLTACRKGNMQWAVRCTSGRRKPGEHDIPVTLNTNLQLTSAVYPQPPTCEAQLFRRHNQCQV